jgi:hypothetical protein
VEVPPSVEVPVMEVPHVEAPLSTEVVPTSDAVGESEEDNSVALEDFISSIMKDTPLPLLDLPPRRRRVDPVLIDAPPRLPSSEASGIRRSRRQALDPISVVIVKLSKRGTVLLVRRLGEIGVPPTSMASAEEAVDNFFRDGPPPHHMDTLPYS